MPAVFEAVSQNSVLQPADCRNTERTSNRSRSAGGANVSVACIRIFRTGKCHGKTESQPPHGMGAKDEQYPKPSNRNHQQRVDLHMREQKYHLCLSEAGHRFLIQNLIWFQNKIRQEGRYTDAVDDLIIKISKIKPKKIRVK